MLLCNMFVGCPSYITHAHNSRYTKSSCAALCRECHLPLILLLVAGEYLRSNSTSGDNHPEWMLVIQPAGCPSAAHSLVSKQWTHFWTRNWSYIATHLVLVVVVGAMLFKTSLRFHHFKSDQDEIWQDCSSSKCASIDGVGLDFMCYHTFISCRKVLPCAECTCICNHVSQLPACNCIYFSWSIVLSYLLKITVLHYKYNILMISISQISTNTAHEKHSAETHLTVNMYK